MNSPAISNHDNAINAITTRRVSWGDDPTVLADIYQEECNIAVWKRHLPSELPQVVSSFLTSDRRFQASMTLSPVDAMASIHKALGGSDLVTPLSQSIAELVDMFCYLFDVKRAGLRLTALNRAMCPKFHVDRVSCRLVTTFQGSATEWLPHEVVDRSKLGRGSEGKPDEESGLFSNLGDIQQLNAGDVALLKGELWDNNEGAGLVHRSPALRAGEQRLLLTLDIT